MSDLAISSRGPFPFLLASPLNFPPQRALDTRTGPIPVSHLPHMLVGQVEALGNSSHDSAHAKSGSEFESDRCRIHGEVQLSERTYCAEVHKTVKKKVQFRIRAEDRIAVGKAFQCARLETGMSRPQLCEALGINGVYTLSRWESGATAPPLEAIRAIGRLISPESRRELYRVTGVTNDETELLQVASPVRTIGVLNSPQELGDPMAAVAQTLPLPSEWLPQDANVRAAKLSTRISPIFGGEVIALVDIRRRDPESLVGCVVMVRTPDGNLPMLLQRHGDTFLLMPIGENSERTARVMQDEGDWSVVGYVMRWLGDAPAPARK